MLGNFFHRPTAQKQRVNKKQKVEIDSPASSGGQGKYMKYVSFPWLPREAALSVLNFGLFFLLKNNIFEKELIKTNDIGINANS
jgi:hypothetical protein